MICGINRQPIQRGSTLKHQASVVVTGIKKVNVIVKIKIMKIQTKNTKWNFNFSLPTILFAVPTALIGHHIHGSLFWAFIDLLFWPLVWIKWLIYHEVTVTIIKETFSWFLV
jgi:hypothetical protein|tara:strand:- start:1 stop:336 length:336 start_codon:yes stop_codon:yes gene_type:complete